MDTETLLERLPKLKDRVSDADADSVKALTCDFLRRYAGEDSDFTTQARRLAPVYSNRSTFEAILDSFEHYIEDGWLDGMSPERRAQLDTVSDVLEQADRLLRDNKTHPAAAAVLIGAGLEEFLRTWMEAEDLSLGNRKPGIQNYATTLRKEKIINKQDVKDITSWSGIRNDAAHGDWDKVSNREKIEVMLQGVNLFMRKYGS